MSHKIVVVADKQGELQGIVAVIDKDYGYRH